LGATSRKETVWLNGVMVAHQDNGTGNNYNSGIATAVGYDPSANHYWGNYKGLIDQAGIYDYALSDAEIMAHASQPGTFHSPDVLYYRMEEPSWNGTPGEVMDWTYGGHPGTAVGDAHVDPNGWYNRAGAFDGNGDSIDAGNSLDLVPSNEITLSAWIKPEDLDNWTHRGSVIARSHSYYLEVTDEGYLGFYLYTSGTNPGWLYDTTDLSTFGDQWIHVAATYDGSQKALYLNGVKVATQAASGLIGADGSHTYVGYADYDRWFQGQIDEAAIFSWALSENQLRAFSAYVPEPSGGLLAGLALLGLGLVAARRKRSSSRGAPPGKG
jgi:MYXO-CTERM domain-containing protein